MGNSQSSKSVDEPFGESLDEPQKFKNFMSKYTFGQVGKFYLHDLYFIPTQAGCPFEGIFRGISGRKIAVYLMYTGKDVSTLETWTKWYVEQNFEDMIRVINILSDDMQDDSRVTLSHLHAAIVKPISPSRQRSIQKWAAPNTDTTRFQFYHEVQQILTLNSISTLGGVDVNHASYLRLDDKEIYLDGVFCIGDRSVGVVVPRDPKSIKDIMGYCEIWRSRHRVSRAVIILPDYCRPENAGEDFEYTDMSTSLRVAVYIIFYKSLLSPFNRELDFSDRFLRMGASLRFD